MRCADFIKKDKKTLNQRRANTKDNYSVNVATKQTCLKMNVAMMLSEMLKNKRFRPCRCSLTVFLF